MDDSKIILCRCENVTLADIRELLESGMDSMQEIKKTCRSDLAETMGKVLL